MSLTTRQRAVFEFVALVAAFTIHRNNHPLRKITTVIVFLTWSISTILILTGYAVDMWVYTLMTFMVAYILGRQHGVEFWRLVTPK